MVQNPNETWCCSSSGLPCWPITDQGQLTSCSSRGTIIPLREETCCGDSYLQTPVESVPYKTKGASFSQMVLVNLLPDSERLQVLKLFQDILCRLCSRLFLLFCRYIHPGIRGQEGRIFFPWPLIPGLPSTWVQPTALGVR